MSPGSVKRPQELGQVYAFIGERVAKAKVRHLDETGVRIAGKLQWLHTTSSLSFTFYRADEKRGAIPEDLQVGVVVHDHFMPYRRLDAVDHAFCNAHILRELQSLIEFDHEPWAELMRDMLLAARLAVDKVGKAAALVPDQLAAFVERYWQFCSASPSIARCPSWRLKPPRAAASAALATICFKG